MKRKNAVVKKAKDVDKNNNTDEDNGIDTACRQLRDVGSRITLTCNLQQ